MTWDQLFDAPGPKKDYDDGHLGPIMRPDAVLLGAVLNYINPKVVVEYGSLDGHSAAVLARFAETLYCIEADNIRPGLHHVARDYPNVVVQHGSMCHWEPPKDVQIDVAYFDASHDCGDSLQAYERIRFNLAPTALLICHDTADWIDQRYGYYKELREAAVNGERDFIAQLRVRHNWHPVAFTSKTKFRHGLTFLQHETGW